MYMCSGDSYYESKVIAYELILEDFVIFFHCERFFIEDKEALYFFMSLFFSWSVSSTLVIVNVLSSLDQ